MMQDNITTQNNDDENKATKNKRQYFTMKGCGDMTNRHNDTTQCNKRMLQSDGPK